MANTYKNIVITPNRGSSVDDPKITFSGGNTSVNTDISLRVYPTSNGTLSFEGSAGQLFSITNDLTGTLFSVNDVSGIPSIEVDANGKVTLAQYSGNVGIGTGTPLYKLDVTGDMRVTGNVILGDASTDTITLNGSVITLGNNQSFDGGTLFIDAVNNEVGIGITNPTSNLHVIGTANITGPLLVLGSNVTQAFISGNAYATAVGTAGNTFASSVGVSANIFATSIGASSNAWANTKVSSSGGTITGDLSITGNLNVSGNTSYINVTNFEVDDPLIYLAGNNYVSDIVDIGFIANYVNATGANVHTGLYREHADKMYYLFQGYDKEPANNHIGALSNNMTLAVLNADVKTSNLTLFGANAQQFIISAFTQANAAPGIANSYATVVGTSANAYATAVGAAGNTYTLAAFNQANTALTTAQGAFNKANSTTYTSNVVIEVADNANAALRITQTGTAEALRVEDETNPDATPFVITSTGNVGVGTLTTTAKLHVQANTGGDGGTNNGSGSALYVKQDNTWSASQPWALYVSGYSYLNGFRINANDGIRGLYKVAAGGSLGFATTGDDPITFTQVNSSERMRIAANGNVGIGTTTPSSRLEVLGGVVNTVSNLGAGDNATITITNSDVSGIGRLVKTLYEIGNLPLAAVGAIYSKFNASNDIGGSLVFGTQNNVTSGVLERMRIDPLGNVGIGTTSPTYTLDVAGSVNASSILTSSLNISGTPLAISSGGTGQTTSPAAINALTGYLTVVSAAGTTTLTNASSQTIYISGTSTQTIVLPDVTTLQLGWTFVVFNGSTNNVTVQSSGLNSFTAIAAGQTARFVCIAVTGTTTSSWVVTYEGASTRSGTGGIVYAVNPALFGPTLNNSRYTLESITAGTNAQGQGAIASSTEIAAVTTTANNPSGVTLNTAAAGKRTTVFNLGTNPIVVYPPTGGVINGLATNAGITIPVGYSLLFEAQTATQWRTQNLGTSGQVLTSGGSSTAPSWTTPSAGGGGGAYSGDNGEASGSGLGDIFRVHTNTLSANVTIYSGNNSIAVGPLTVAAGKTLTVQANARVVIA